uniref:UDENN domain-containing protein n=1 Tax=Panagrolaimus sp. JU765 TaxID=591449 RepID=A0AC34Q5Q0_9BILA
MASRVRTNAPNVYDAFYIFKYQDSSINLIKKYPPDLDDSASIEAIKKFCFPKAENNWDASDPVANFTFTLTDGQGLFTFGHCRFSPSKAICTCILSAIPDLAFFKYTLNYLSIAGSEQVDRCLDYLYHTQIPEGEQVVKFADVGFSFILRDFHSCFCSFKDREVLTLFDSIQFSSHQIIFLYASMLKERRIIITASKLETLSNCAFGALKLMYPFHWQSIFIPILPSDLIDQLQAPMPYLIGVPKETLKTVDLSGYGEVVVLDIDERVFSSDNEDLLPNPIVKFLAKQLKKESVSSPDAIVRAFMKATVIIFGRYRSGLCKADSFQNTQITWDRHKFVSVQPPELKSFVQALVCEEGAQYFERFIDERLAALNSNKPLSEEFDTMLRDVDQYWNEALDASRNFKDTVHGAVMGVKNNTNAVFGTIKGTVQQALKKKPSFTPKLSRKKKEIPIPPYSFAPPVIGSPEKQPEAPSFPPPSSPEVDLLFFDNQPNDTSNTTEPSGSSIQSDALSAIFTDSNSSHEESRMPTSSTPGRFDPAYSAYLIHLQLSSTNPFNPTAQQNIPSRDNWEKFD